MSIGWRTIVSGTPSTLRYDEGTMLVERENDTKVIPISQMRQLLIASKQSKITTALIAELNQENISTVFCDEKFNPLCELVPYGTVHNAAGRIMDQAAWTVESKNEVWADIVIQKIHNQRENLVYCGKDAPPILKKYEEECLPGDRTNREGQAARIYFSALFGTDFVRHHQDNINAALDYGYTILLATMNQILALHGYHTALGINHCSRNNRFNLSCDLIEPFRPLIDRFVFFNLGRELDAAFKNELREIMSDEINYEGFKMTFSDAMEQYALSMLRCLVVGKKGRADYD